MFGPFGNPTMPVNSYAQQQPMQRTSYPMMGVPMQQPMMGGGILKGRIVSNVDEVKAAPIDLDGSMTYFPCPAENCIYAKSIDLNGRAVLMKYSAELPQQAPQYAEAGTVSALAQRVQALENLMKGGNINAQSNDVTSNGPVDVQP